jgi:hypothetical protein
MKKITIVFVLLALAYNVHAQNVGVGTKRPDKPPAKELAKIKAASIKKAAKTQFQFFVIKTNNSTYGYSIYANGNLYIQQNTIPAISGTSGFADTTSASKTAQLVIQKIKLGEMPPTISTSDLKKISVL